MNPSLSLFFLSLSFSFLLFLSLSLSLYVYTWIYLQYLSVCPSICLSICLSIYILPFGKKHSLWTFTHCLSQGLHWSPSWWRKHARATRLFRRRRRSKTTLSSSLLLLLLLLWPLCLFYTSISLVSFYTMIIQYACWGVSKTWKLL